MLYNIDLRLVTFIMQSILHWRTTLTANLKNIAGVTIKCGIYQEYALSPLLFCIVLNPLSAWLDKSAYGYRFKSGTTINHFQYIYNIKLYAKNEKDLDSLIISLGCLVPTFGHIISGCSKLTGTEYTERYNNAASIVYRVICAEHNLEHSKD